MTNISALKILDLGCGNRKHPGAVGVDKEQGSCADIIVNLDDLPYPFQDNSWDIIYCCDVLEHMHNTVRVIEELYRISKPGARIIISCPHFSSHNAYTDLTHQRAFGVRSFDFFSDEESMLIRYARSKARFKILKKKIVPNRFMLKSKKKIIKIRNRPLEYFINLSAFVQDIYERFFCFILTAEGVSFELKVIK